MAHNLTIRRDGLAEMAYVRQNPWHGLGKYLGDNPVTSETMMREASLDWTVEIRDLYYPKLGEGGVNYETIKNMVATVRADSQDLLGVVSKDYKPLQQREAFDLMDRIVGEAAAMYETAGSLQGGKRVWALAKLPQELVVVGEDRIGEYLLMTNAHDGTHALVVAFTPIRVVCDNTLTAALDRWERTVTNKVVVRHIGDVQAKVEEARRILGVSLKYFEIAGEVYRTMSARQIDDLALQAYLTAVIPTSPAPTDDVTGLRHAQLELERQRIRHIHVTLAELFDGAASGGSLPGVKGTLWGAYNAVTEWVDHVRLATKDGRARKGGYESALFGEGQAIKQRAFDEAIKVLRS